MNESLQNKLEASNPGDLNRDLPHQPSVKAGSDCTVEPADYKKLLPLPQFSRSTPHSNCYSSKEEQDLWCAAPQSRLSMPRHCHTHILRVWTTPIARTMFLRRGTRLRDNRQFSNLYRRITFLCRCIRLNRAPGTYSTSPGRNIWTL